MRLLHTSDWHLGRTLHGADLAPAHHAWVDHLVQVVREERVDAVLLSGDVFDRAIAPADAVELWDDAVARVTDAGAALVVSSGNHDSAVRLGTHGRLLARAGLHVRTSPDRLLDPVLLSDPHGTVAVWPLPYLEPTLTGPALARASAPGVPALDLTGPAAGASVARDQAGAVARACDLVRGAAAAAGHGRDVVMAHTWVGGLERTDLSDSERDIGAATTVGTLDRVPLEAFDGFSYVALGHLHGRRTVREHVRYSGSPVAFSFSERAHRKGSWLVDLDATGVADMRWVDAPVLRRLTQLTGTLEQLLVDPAHTGAEGDWVKAVLTDVARPAEAMARLQTRFRYALALEHAPAGAAGRTALGYADRLRSAPDDLAVVLGFVEHVRGTVADDAEREVLSEVLAAARVQVGAG